jgi:hypothetical protein
MTKDINLEELSEEQKNLSARVFDLVIGRVLKNAYLDFSEEVKKEMDKVFNFGNGKEKEDFVKKYIPNFEKIFKEEAKKFEEEIKLDIASQV